MIAYTDETGNSGTALFDANQPYFWTGTLVSEHDMQTVAADLHAECLSIVEKKELHGSELGLGRIEKIAGKLRAFFAETGCKFFFTSLEKAHLAATKLADTVLDSGNNMAIAPVQYGIKGLRVPLAWDIVQIMSDEDRQAFWAAFEGADAPGFVTLLYVLRTRVLELSQEGVLYDRNTQLLTDAFTWGIQHPEDLLQGGMHPLDSPNAVAFTLILNHFHSLHESTGARVKTFIHDEQNQFGKWLEKSYDLLKGFAFKVDTFSPLPDVKKVPTFACDMVMAESLGCIGLQLVDVVLWLTKRFVDMNGALHGECGALANFVMHNGSISDFSRRQMLKDFLAIADQVDRMELSPEKMKQGRYWVKRFEKQRLERMNKRLTD